MALNDLGKVAMTFGGEYSASTVYERLTVVVANDGQTYGTIADNVVGIEPGGSANWQNYWQIISMRGPRGNGIQSISKTATSGAIDTYTITYDDGEKQTYKVTNGQGIQSIVLTNTSGNIDTYTITFGNNQTATFTVTNARELAAGGNAGQFLAKNSNADYDVAWKSLPIVNNLTTQSSSSALSANQGYQLDQKKAEAAGVSISVSTSGWTLDDDVYTKTVSVPGVTPSNILVVSPFHANMSSYVDAGVKATTQGTGTLTFEALEVPSENMTVNVLIINA